MATLDTQTVTTGAFTTGDPPFQTTYAGYSRTGQAPAAFGSIVDGTSNIYSGANINQIYTNSLASNLIFKMAGTVTNGGWATMDVNGTTFNRTSASFSGGNTWTWSGAASVFGSSAGLTRVVVWDDGVGTAPVIGSVTDNNVAVSQVTTTVNLSSSGSGGGTLQYAQTTTNSLPATGWQASNTFTQARGTTRYYWASRNTNVSLYSSSVTYAVGYLSPDTTVTLTNNSPVAPGATSHQVTIADASEYDTYHVRSGSYTGTILATGSPPPSLTSVTITVNDVPAAGSTNTYYITATKSTVSGGDNTTHFNVNTYNITRNQDPVIGSVTDDNAAAANVTATVNMSVNGVGGGTLQYAQTTTNSLPSTGWQAGNTFAHPRGATRYYWASRNTNVSLYSASVADAVGYLSPDTTVTLTNNSPVAPGAASHQVTISDGDSNTTYHVRSGSYSGTILATGIPSTTSVAITVNDVPAQGGTNTYYITATRSTASGGDNTTHFNVTTYTITRNQDPVIGSVTDDNAAAANVTATVNMSVNGVGGGTLQYAQTTTNALPATGWQAGNTFTHPRGATRYYWASRNTNVSLYSASVADAVGYLSPDSTITTTTNSPVVPGATSHQVTIANGDSNTTYHVRSGSYTGTILATGTPSTTSVAITVNDVPAAGSTSTYYITATRSTASGGDNTTHFNATTYTITRNQDPVIGSVTDNNAAAVNVTATVNMSVNGVGGGTLQYAQTTTNSLPSTGWQAGNTFTQARGTTRYYWASRNTNASLYSTSVAYTAGYIAPDTSITTATNSPIVVGASTHTVTVQNGSTNTTYYVRLDSYSGTILGSATTDVLMTISNVPAIGATKTYYITANVATSSGGDGLHVNATTYNITRNNFDSTPDAFSFTDVSDAATNLPYTSNEVTITGIDTSVTVSISGGSGQYRKFTGGAWGAYTASNGTASVNDKFQLRLTSSTLTGTAVSTTLTVGGTSDTYSITTAGSATDSTPDQFSFNSINGATKNQVYASNAITVTGINTTTAVSISNGEYEKNNSGTWTSQNGTASVNDTFKVRHTSSNQQNITTSTTLTIGGVAGTFSTTTASDINTSNYGLEIYNSSETKVLAVSSRVPRLVTAGSATITVGTTVATYSSSAISVTGISPTDDSWQILITEHGDYDPKLAYYYTIASGSFTLKIDRVEAGGTSQSRNVYYFVLRD